MFECFGMFIKPLFGSSVATCRLTCSEISLLILKQTNKKAREISRQQSHNVLTGSWRDNFSSVPCFVL